MATILRFASPAGGQAGEHLRDVRREFAFTLAQAAAALGVSASTVENWERTGSDRITVAAMRRAYSIFAEDSNWASGNNLVFGCYPIRLARQLLELSVAEMAVEFGYTKSAWLKIEANARCLSKDRIAEIENRVRTRLAAVCC